MIEVAIVAVVGSFVFIIRFFAFCVEPSLSFDAGIEIPSARPFLPTLRPSRRRKGRTYLEPEIQFQIPFQLNEILMQISTHF